MKLSFVKIYVDVDLRRLMWNLETLNEAAAGHNLKEGQAVLYCNKAHDKWRVVTVKNELPLLVLPPVDKKNKIEQHRRVLHAFTNEPGLVEFVADEFAFLETRYRRRAAVAQQLLTDRKKEV